MEASNSCRFPSQKHSCLGTWGLTLHPNLPLNFEELSFSVRSCTHLSICPCLRAIRLVIMDEKCVADCSVIDGACGSSSSSGSKRKKVLLQVVSKKLQVLEEEASMMRKSMVVCMNERREIITQISHLFQTIQSHSSVLQTKQPLPLCLEKRQKKVGLLQALSEDSNPSLVLRGPMTISPADAVACLDYG